MKSTLETTARTTDVCEVLLDMVDADEHRSRSYAAYFADISRGLLSDSEEPVTFQKVVERAVHIVPGCDAAGIVVRRPRRTPASAAGTHESAEALDTLQFELGEGPCLSIGASGVALSHDLQHESQWARWTAQALAQDFRSVLCIGLQTEEEDFGALTLYGREAHVFDEDAVDVAEIFAVHATTALHQARLVTGLRTALESRHEIGLAQGLLAQRYDISYEQAFELLRRYSSHANTKLRDVARRVVADRCLPDDLLEKESPLDP